ncbi:vitamin K epoxide reductase [Rothia nasimurium]|uniref:Vitamin K epoxide reductase n=1 Tax=Rothia nasimurium TaxID=85336 RepID=A0A1Y1RRV5_9MICC|nr:vitamin K epoxide reductase family protein [Rothia nasimurium]ORC22121.1 vitamin K epoxide reductase [Rothia nasimurium]
MSTSVHTPPEEPTVSQTVADRRLGWFTLLPGLLAFGSAGMLVYERLQIYMDAAHKSVCDINALLNCGTVMRTWQAEAFGFPNPFIGIAGYAIVLTISTALLAGANFARWYWVAMQVGHTLALGFVFWLWYNTTFEINALCLFCMIVWVMQIAIFVKVTTRNIHAGVIPAPEAIREAAPNWTWFTIILMYILVFGIIFIRFFDVIVGMF